MIQSRFILMAAFIAVATSNAVFAAVDITAFGMASQGSTYTDDAGVYSAGNAVDSDPQTYNHTQCDASTDWWQLELPNNTLITEVVITSRLDRTDRLLDAKVYLSNSAYLNGLDNAVSLGTLQNVAEPQPLAANSVDTFRYVIVKGAQSCLHLSEVKVFGEPGNAPQFYGSDQMIEVPVSTQAGATIATLRAVDFQGDDVSYRVDAATEAAGFFSVTAMGELTLIGALTSEGDYSVTVTASDGANDTAFDLTVAVVPLFEDITRYGVASQGSLYGDGLPQLAVDGDLTTYNHTNCDAQSNWWQLALPNETRFSEVRITGRSGQTARLADASVYLSADSFDKGLEGALFLGNLEGIADQQTLKVTNPGRYGYLAVKATTSCLHLAEVQVFGVLASAPQFNVDQTQFLFSNGTQVGVELAQFPATDYQGDSVAYSLSGADIFSIAPNGSLTLSSAPPLAGGTYTPTITISDGVNESTLRLEIQFSSSTAVEDAMASGSVDGVADGELEIAIREEIESASRKFDPVISELFDLNVDGSAAADQTSLTSVSWDPGGSSALFFPRFGENVALFNQPNADGSTLAIAGVSPARFAALGSNPISNEYRYPGSLSADMQRFLVNLFEWLVPQNNLAVNGFNVVIAHVGDSTYFPDETSIREWLDATFKDAEGAPLVSYNEPKMCDSSKLAGCLTTADLLIISQLDLSENPEPIVRDVKAAMERGVPVLYVHYNSKLLPLGEQLFSLLNIGFAAENRWRRERVVEYDASGLFVEGTLPANIKAIDTMIQHFMNRDYVFDWGSCGTGGACAAVEGFASEFLDGAAATQSIMQDLDSKGYRIFERGEGFRLERLLALLGDKYREDIVYPMDKLETDTNLFLRAYYSDFAVLYSRLKNPVGKSLGNFSRTDFSAVVPQNQIVTLLSKRPFKSTGAYALPGQTFRVRRTDQQSTVTSIFINTLRSGSTHEWETYGYKRPKFLRSPSFDIAPGEELVLTSPYGGPIQVAFGDSDQDIVLEIDNVGQHPYWTDPSDDEQFNTDLAANLYDWAELVTPYFEVHSTAAKMRDSIERWGSLARLGELTMLHAHNYPLVLAGYQGPFIDQVPEIHEFAQAKGWQIDVRDEMKHMNADQATCGYGCSGNPYDAYWSFDPLGHGDIHEIGHSLERGRFRFTGWELHAITNPYSYYSRSAFNQRVGENIVECGGLPFSEVYEALRMSLEQPDPTAYLQNEFWPSTGWSHQFLQSLQTWMAAQREGVVSNGWHVLARLHIYDREFSRADDSEAMWLEKRDSLGFGTYEYNEIGSISNNDWNLIALATVTERDYLAFLTTWGQSFSEKAVAQLNLLNLSPMPVEFALSSASGYCQVGQNGDMLSKPAMAITVENTWPEEIDTDSDGYWDALDDLPADPSEITDTDGDGLGNNADTDDDGDGVLDVQEVLDGTNPLDASDFIAPYDNLHGLVYHWSQHSVVAGATITRTSDTDAQVLTDNQGQYTFEETAEGAYELIASQAISDADTNRTITSADALAALKIAVGLNPNSDPDGDGPLEALAVSPYQLIAADMNQDGRVTSADALAILKVAVGLSDALEPAWQLVEDSQALWTTHNDKSKVFNASQAYALTYPDQTEANFAAVLLGDVNASWKPQENAQSVTHDHFSAYAKTTGAPLALWGIRDSDQDGLSDKQEEALGTSLFDADTDADGVNDIDDAYPLDPDKSEDAPTGVASSPVLGESPRKTNTAPITLVAPVLLRGDMNDWGKGDVFTQLEDGSSSLVIQLQRGTYTFKIATDDWAVMDLGAEDEASRLVAMNLPVRLSANSTASFVLTITDEDRIVFAIDQDVNGDMFLVVSELQ